MKVLIFPTYNNPYQHLLYTAMHVQENVTVTSLDNAFFRNHYLLLLLVMPVRLIYFRMQGYRIFHLHWQHFHVPFFSKNLGRFVSTIYAIFILLLIKAFGFKLIWTVHNIVPHTNMYLNNLMITRLIMRLANQVIVHSKITIEELSQHALRTSSSTVIPMGNYRGVYPDNTTDSKARTYFNISKKTFVILFFGMIEEYKGVETAFHAFKSLYKDYDVTLLIAGYCKDKLYKKKLTKEFTSLKASIIYHIDYVEDQNLQYYFHAADVVVFPFTKITTSSSAMLALSFGKPIIVPSKSIFSDWPRDIGYYFDSAKDIEHLLKEAYQNRGELKRKAMQAKEFAQSFSWKKIAMQTIAVYREALLD